MPGRRSAVARLPVQGLTRRLAFTLAVVFVFPACRQAGALLPVGLLTNQKQKENRREEERDGQQAEEKTRPTRNEEPKGSLVFFCSADWTSVPDEHRYTYWLPIGAMAVR